MEVSCRLPIEKSSCADTPLLVSSTRVFISLLICRLVGEGTTGPSAAANSGLLVTALVG